MLWKGYSREEATWVLEQDITLPAFTVSIIFHSTVATINFGISLLCRYFHSPQPEVRVVLDDVSTFIYNINHSLICGVNRACSFSFPFRTDVFNYLFVLIGLVY